MVGRLLPVVLTVLVLLAGCVGQATSADDPATGAVSEPEPTVYVLELVGHIIQDEVGEGSHTRTTEELLWGVQKVGWTIEVPDNVTDFELVAEWASSAEFQLDVHSHNHTTMKCCIRHQTQYTSEKPLCMRVPAGDIHPGEYEPMIRTSGAIREDFKITVLTVGSEVEQLERRHGHDRAAEAQEGRSDSFPAIEECRVWPMLNQ